MVLLASRARGQTNVRLSQKDAPRGHQTRGACSNPYGSEVRVGYAAAL